MKDTLGLIFTEDTDTRLNELTAVRTACALPIGGRYRLIDFMLSSMVNSGIVSVGVTADCKYSSLLEHLRSGAPWDLQRSNLGLTVMPPYINKDRNGKESGSADLLAGVMPFLQRSRQKYVLIGGGDTVFNMRFEDVMRFHRESRADITVIYTKEREKEALSHSNVLEIDENGRVFGLEKNPRDSATQNASMNIYFMERRFLMRLAESASARGEHDIIMDFISKRLSEIRIFAYRYDGFCCRADNVLSYYKCNMKMLDTNIRKELFGSENKIYTRVYNQTPAIYGADAGACNSLVADGCTVEGNIENCVVFRGVRIGKGTTIKNCVLMEKTFIGKDSELSHIILDKECVVREGARLCAAADYPMLIGKGEVV